MDKLLQYFPDLTDWQKTAFESLGGLYLDWNKKINVISRKDIQNLYLHHIIHSLAISYMINFRTGTKILDIGTGGGFPGIPAAIFFPDCQFKLIDGTRKKLVVVSDIIEKLGLKNVEIEHIRAEDLSEKFQFILARGVASLDKLLSLSKPLISKRENNPIPNGLLAFKGGDISAELKNVSNGNYYEQLTLSDHFEEPFFEKKYIIYIQA